VVLIAGAASAADPDRVEWSPDWPRVRLVEVLDVIALTLASYEIDAQWPPPHSGSWRGGILFDGAVRDALRGRTYDAQSTAASLSDTLYKAGVIAPYVVDVYFVGLGIHQNADVAIQMLLIDMQSLGAAGVVSLAAEHAVGRARPYFEDCGADNVVRDASGRPLFNTCGTGIDFQSFYSGHAAATATMAGLTCAHHQHLPLYGGGLADLAPCLVMIGTSLTTGVARVVADRHWASDVVTGWGVGALAGYVLPSVLHYGFSSGRPLGAVQVGGARLVPVPQAYVAGAGVALVGSY
jgi:membrane-associated phospholipid phosphatase